MRNISKEIINEMKARVEYFIDENSFNFACIINGLIPLITFTIGYYIDNKSVTMIEFILLLLLVIFIFTVLTFASSYLKAYANKIGKGEELPVPSERFTTEDEFGEVFVNVDRMQEMILYVADVENHLKRKGFLK